MKKKFNNIYVIIILAIIVIFIGLLITDIIRISITKKDLKESSNIVLELFYQELEEEEIVNYINKDIDDNFIKYNISYEDSLITLTRSIKIYTPGLDLILGNPYTIKASAELELE
ncbi:MAG: hypothetical protein PHQ89_00040 [Bacilli bacterium]|nr:hypothetical protein [Bacilli bacterium]